MCDLDTTASKMEPTTVVLTEAALSSTSAANPMIEKDLSIEEQEQKVRDYYEYETEDTVDASSFSSEGSRGKAIKSKVSFGIVNVHKHRMTLSTNPFAVTGIPVELAWGETSCEEFRVDDFEKKFAKKNLRKMTSEERLAIVEQHHSRGSITLIEEQLKGARASIYLSKRDDPENLVIIAPAPTSCCTIL